MQQKDGYTDTFARHLKAVTGKMTTHARDHRNKGEKLHSTRKMLYDI